MSITTEARRPGVGHRGEPLPARQRRSPRCLRNQSSALADGTVCANPDETLVSLEGPAGTPCAQGQRKGSKRGGQRPGHTGCLVREPDSISRATASHGKFRSEKSRGQICRFGKAVEMARRRLWSPSRTRRSRSGPRTCRLWPASSCAAAAAAVLG